ncbi:hypothetical protein [Streptomyces sp. bgisy126]|uniref:hypothetical protein n=1 Tax=unclassified Streptomyces TaxID=2593676 RepID=UPI003EB74985
MALSAVRDQREGYARRLQEFAEQHRGRLEEMLRGYGPGSAPAAYGLHAGRPTRRLVVERMDSMPFLLRGRWKQELEEVLLDNLEFVWRPCVRLGR